MIRAGSTIMRTPQALLAAAINSRDGRVGVQASGFGVVGNENGVEGQAGFRIWDHARGGCVVHFGIRILIWRTGSGHRFDENWSAGLLDGI